MLLFVSVHFTQSCAFIAYLFRFYGLLFVVYRGKSTHFFESARDLMRFFVSYQYRLYFFPKIRITTALLEIT